MESDLHFSTRMVSYANLALIISSIASIKQFFWPGESIRLVFHIFNLLFVVLFYSLSLPFLLNHIDYYPDYNGLSTMAVIGKFFFGMGFYSFLQWLVVSGGVINILYIRKYRKDYFNLGMSIDHDDQPAKAPAEPEQDTEVIRDLEDMKY
jgi:hypothetical protein